MINRRLRPRGVLQLWQRRSLHRTKRPVLFDGRSLRDPTLENFLLRRSQRFVFGSGRHLLVFVVAQNSSHEFTLVRFARDDRHLARFTGPTESFFLIESQAPFPLRRVRPVTLPAMIRQDRPHIPIKRNSATITHCRWLRLRTKR